MGYNFEDMIKRIRALKKEAGLSNKQLAALSDVPLGTLNKILSFETKEPSINAIIKISFALRVPTSYIINGSAETTAIAKDMNISAEEIKQIAKYRKLDAYGKKAVDSLLEIESERCQESLSKLDCNLGKSAEYTPNK